MGRDRDHDVSAGVVVRHCLPGNLSIPSQIRADTKFRRPAQMLAPFGFLVAALHPINSLNFRCHLLEVGVHNGWLARHPHGSALRPIVYDQYPICANVSETPPQGKFVLPLLFQTAVGAQAFIVIRR